MRLYWKNIISLIDQKVPLKPLKVFPNTISRCAHYILLALHWFGFWNNLNRVLDFLQMIYLKFMLSVDVTWHLSHVMCHMPHFRGHISDVTRHVSPVANTSVICWPTGNFISPVKSFNSMMNLLGISGKNKGTFKKKRMKKDVEWGVLRVK